MQLAIDPKDINNPSIFDLRGRAVINVRLILENNSNDTLKFWSMTCSWEDFYEIDNKNIVFYGDICDKNAKTIVSLAPHETHSMKTQLFITENLRDGNYKFKIGMHLFKYPKYDRSIHFKKLLLKHPKNNFIWSNEVDLMTDHQYILNNYY